MSKNKLPYHYDEPRGLVISYSYPDFIKTLSLLSKLPIDVNSTLKNVPYVIIHEDGTASQYYRWFNLFSNLESKYGIVIDQARSHVSSNMFFLKTTPPAMKYAPEVEIAEVSLVVNGEPFKQHSQIDADEPLTPVEDDSKEESKEIDISLYEKLLDEDDVRKSKNLLAEKAKEDLGVTLKKNQPFDKMIEQLKESLIS